MSKINKIIGKILVLFIVIILSVDSFAAVVSDNDGSAFITKAEFDSLKNDFQSQLDQYNTSIDNKIDSAIASYIAGIKVEKTTDLPILVEKYKDIYWCNDFSLFARKGTFSSWSSHTYDAAAAVKPDYTNRVGYSFYMNNRGARITWHNHNYWGGFMMPFRMAFESDNTGATRNSGRQGGENGSHILCLNVDDKDVIVASDPLRQHNRVFYLWCRFGYYTWGGGSPDPFGNLNGWKIEDYPTWNWRFTIEPMTPDTNSYLKMKYHIQWNQLGTTPKDRWEIINFTSDNTEAFPTQTTDYSTEQAVSENSSLVSFPMYDYCSPSDDQTTADKTRIANMMLGQKSTYQMPILYNLKPGGRTGQTPFATPLGYTGGSDINNIEGTSYNFPDWSRWGKKTVTATFDLPEYVTTLNKPNSNTTPGGWISNQYPTALYDTTKSTANISIPVTTLFAINTVKSPTAIYKNNNLNICAGIPIAENITQDAKLKVVIKTDKKYDDVTQAAITDSNAKIRFKKSDFTNSASDYHTGTEDTDSGTTITFDNSHTINIKNKTFYLNVKKGDSVWMNIDPITLGQHIRITDMSVTLVVEQ